MGGSKYCVFFGCLSNTHRVTNLSFFKLPLDAERRLKWLKIINRMDLDKPGLNPKSYVVCSKHFEKSAIVMTPRLKIDALPIAEVNEFTRNQATQTDMGILDVATVKIEPKDTKIGDSESEDEDTEIEDKEHEPSESENTNSEPEHTDIELNIKNEIEVTETEVAFPVNKIAVKRKPSSNLSESSSNKRIKLDKTKRISPKT